MRVVEVQSKDRELIEKIYLNELESFGVMGGADMWMIMSFIRYGKLYTLVDEKDNLLSVAQYQGVIGKQEAFLYGFSTSLKERGKGYGKILLKDTHRKLKDIGIKKIYLTVDPQNKIAINMYEKEGYKIEELQQDEYGRGVHRYLMMKKLM
ncbi:GNAT family N-acetyltransferase [Cetobacterium somerae]|uniref:GNAT family N-acetyltransferase n=1 Tax=Cetobacterium sp. NK01 TaxID=2993530 RepID=UPI002116289A|nr:GNAT family N-acetyltransferase [Cetobacterium sp. NK01]MCQ8212268.1 GNAT family N-acetyltransferase [Cetobacterium sp. NK01]